MEKIFHRYGLLFSALFIIISLNLFEIYYINNMFSNQREDINVSLFNFFLATHFIKILLQFTNLSLSIPIVLILVFGKNIDKIIKLNLILIQIFIASLIVFYFWLYYNF